MKKIVSLVTAILMIASVLTCFAGCAKTVSGTEAAKILLANERLDEKSVGQGLNIISTDTKLGAFEKGAPQMLKLSADDGFVELKTAHGVEIGSDYARWSGFETYSERKDDYMQFITPIDEKAAELASLIVEVKQNVGITDKWVKGAYYGDSVMLRVDGNSETLITKSKDGDYEIGRRYTDNEGQNIYELYSFYDHGTVYNMCIPGLHYEYMFEHVDGYSDFFVADNSRGYWSINRFAPYVDENTAVNFDMDVVKDGIAYGTVIDIAHLDEVEFAARTVDISMPDASRDLMRIATYTGDEFEIGVYMSNVTDGVASLFAEGSAFDGLWVEEYGGSGDVYITADIGEGIELELENGKTLSYGDGSENVKYIGAEIAYSPEYNGDCYTGIIKFRVKADGVDTALDTLESFFDENGIELYSDNRVLSEAYGHADLLAENFGEVTEWRGFELDSVDTLEKATGDYRDSIKAQEKLFDEVKDYESVGGSYKLSGGTDFADAMTDGGNAVYKDGEITLEALTLNAESSVLFEEGREYTLNLAITRKESDGSLSAVNIAVIGEGEKTAYSGEALSVSASGSYEIPLNFSEGEYVVVAYAATADEGIRVTKFVPIAFYSADEGGLESVYMNISTELSGENLFVNYGVKHTLWTECEVAKDEYSYSDIRNALIRGALREGYPVTDAPIQTEDGENISENKAYGGGIYRMKFMIMTHGELTEAYIYCDFE